MEFDRLSRLETRVTALETQAAVEDVHRDNVGARLGSIEDTLKWPVRLVMGGLLMAAIAFVIQGGLVPWVRIHRAPSAAPLATPKPAIM